MPKTTPRSVKEDDLRSPLLASENLKSPELLGIDEMLQKYCGEFGVWQLRHFVLTSLAWALEGFHAMVMIFADREPPGICRPGDCASSFEVKCGLESSTAAEWGLVCRDKYKVGLVQAIFFGGCLIGAGIFGHLSDSFLGRKGTLITVSILNAFFGFLTAFSPNYYAYCAIRLLTGLSTGGVGLCAFVLATEPIGPAKRGQAGMSTFYFFSAGIGILSVVAYVTPSWRALYLVTSIPSLVFAAAAGPFLTESPRWYLVRGEVDKALKVMAEIAASNGKCLPDHVTLVLDNNNTDRSPEQNISGRPSGSVLDVVYSPVTRVRLLLAVTINFLCSVVYYGLTLNVVNIDIDLYLNVALNAAAEMPAYALTAVFLDKYGRRPLLVFTMWFSGVCCLLGAVAGGVGGWRFVRMGCGVWGIFGMAGTYNLLFIYTTELFPTVVRSAALGCASQAAQMGAILAPLVVVLGGGVPFFVFAVCGVGGGVLAFFFRRLWTGRCMIRWWELRMGKRYEKFS